MKIDYIKVSSVTDKFVLSEKINKKVFNSSSPWSLWKSFFIVVLSSLVFALCLNFCHLKYNVFIYNLESFDGLFNIGKILFSHLLLWFLLTIIGTRINQKEYGNNELVCNIGHMLALVYLFVLPASIVGLFLNIVVKEYVWIFVNLLYIIFLLANIGTFFYACSEKTKKAPELEFVYVAKKITLKYLQAAIIFILFFIIGGIYYLSALSPVSEIINRDIIFRPTIIIFALAGILALPVVVGMNLRLNFEDSDKNAFLISFYAYGKAICFLFMSIFLVDIFFVLFGGLTIDNALSNIYYIISLYLVLVLFFMVLIYQTNLIFSPNGYGYYVDIVKKKFHFKDILSLKISLPNIKNKVDLSEKQNLSEKMKDKLDQEVDLSFLRTILDFFTFDLLFTKDKKAVYIPFAYFSFVFINAISGLLFYFYKFSFLKYIINTNVIYVDIFVGMLWSVVFLLGISFVFYIVLKSFKIKGSFFEIFTNINYSLIPFAILVCISLFLKENARNIILDYFLYVALSWALAYFVLYHSIHYSIEKKKRFFIWIFNVLLIVVMFFGLSYFAYYTNIRFYSIVRIPLVNTRVIDYEESNRKVKSLEEQVPKKFQENISASMYKMESVDWVSMSIGDLLSHVEHMSKYSNLLSTEDDFNIRIANEAPINYNWATFIYKKQPKNIRKASRAKEKAMKILDFVNTNIKEEETTYPFGEAFWQDSVTTFKRKYGTKPDIAVLIVAMLRTNGVPAKINKEILPDRFFNNSYSLVDYYDGSAWKPLYPKQKVVKSDRNDLNKLKTWVENGAKSNLAFYYINDGEPYAYGNGDRYMVATYSLDLLPGKYMASYKNGSNVELYFFNIRKAR